MTNIRYTNSTSVANDFAVKLLSGLLNVRPDLEVDGCPLIDKVHTTPDFTTEDLKLMRPHLTCFELTRLEIGESDHDPDSRWSQNEIRDVAVYAKMDGMSERLVAEFAVYREYMDGEEAEGWARWQVKDVSVIFPDSGPIHLVRYLHPNRDDREPVWGTTIEP